MDCTFLCIPYHPFDPPRPFLQRVFRDTLLHPLGSHPLPTLCIFKMHLSMYPGWLLCITNCTTKKILYFHANYTTMMVSLSLLTFHPLLPLRFCLPFMMTHSSCLVQPFSIDRHDFTHVFTIYFKI